MNGARFRKYASQIAAGLALCCVVAPAAAQDQALYNKTQELANQASEQMKKGDAVQASDPAASCAAYKNSAGLLGQAVTQFKAFMVSYPNGPKDKMDGGLAQLTGLQGMVQGKAKGACAAAVPVAPKPAPVAPKPIETAALNYDDEDDYDGITVEEVNAAAAQRRADPALKWEADCAAGDKSACEKMNANDDKMPTAAEFNAGAAKMSAETKAKSAAVADSASELGEELSFADTIRGMTKEDLLEARKQYQAMSSESKLLTGCVTGNQDDCIDYGVALAKGTPKLPQDRARAITYFDGACSKGIMLGCRNSGSTNIALGEASFPAARVAYEKGCLLGDGNSCFRQSMMVGRGAGGIKDPKQGVVLMKKSCLLKFEEACSTIQRADAKRAEREKQSAYKPYDIDAKVPAK